jgi:soluble lytic murein transglycosylase-like protein
MLPLLAAILSLLPLDGVHYSAIKHGLRHGIDPALVMAVIQVESSGNRFARNGGCVGLMQVNKRVWKLDERRMFEVDYNIEQGVRVLRQYLDRAKGDVIRALHFYNNGISGKHNNKSYAPKVLREYKKIRRTR